MDTRPSIPDLTEKPIPLTNRLRAGIIIIASLIGLGLGGIGGLIAGGMAIQIGGAQYPGLELGLIMLFLGPVIVFPIVGLCTGLVAAAQRSAERGLIVGMVIFGGSQLILYGSSLSELWRAVGPVIIIAAIVGALIGGASAGMSAVLSPGSSAPHPVTGEAGK